MSRYRLLPFTLLALAGLTLAGPLENVRVGSWVYSSIDVLRAAGLIQSVPWTSRPWTRAYAARLVKEAQEFETRRGRASYLTQPPGARPLLRRPGLVEYHLERLVGEFADELGPPAAATGLRRGPPLLRVPADSSLVVGFDPLGRVFADTWNLGVRLGLIANTMTGKNLVFSDRLEITEYARKLPSFTDSAGIHHVPGMREDRWAIPLQGGVSNVLVGVPEAYARFAPSWFELELGRDYAWWGPSYLSPVMLSDNAPSLDGYRFGANFSRFKFVSMTAVLSPWREWQRFLSAQRLEVNLWQRLVIGFALFATYTPDSGRTSEFGGYLYPLLPLYPTFTNDLFTDNMLAGGDFAVYLPHVKVYGQQLMIDDLNPYRRNAPSDTMSGGLRSKGLQLGALADLAGLATLRYEYVAISNYTYYHRYWYLAYTQYGVPLGHALGPDADQHYLLLDVYPSGWGYVSLLGSFTRRGSKNRGDFRNRTWYEGKPTWFHSFPTGIVENTFSIGPRVTVNPFSWLRLQSGVQWYTASNAGGSVGAHRSGLSFDISLDYRY